MSAKCRPHARGGGPVGGTEALTLEASSPRAWGWTVIECWVTEPDGVVPTRVGVDRDRGRPDRPCVRRPHARGGGPVDWRGYLERFWSSPRAWGWTEEVLFDRPGPRVVPTRVGVDRLIASRSSSSSCRPHARGGGPDAGNLPLVQLRSSPRAWGWTGHRVRAGHGGRVVPTRVGVDRSRTRSGRDVRRRPHARGGGPVDDGGRVTEVESSPRAWGWTGDVPDALRKGEVVPTRVGVDRASSTPQPARACRPHARGGGPSYRELMAALD